MFPRISSSVFHRMIWEFLNYAKCLPGRKLEKQEGRNDLHKLTSPMFLLARVPPSPGHLESKSTIGSVFMQSFPPGPQLAVCGVTNAGGAHRTSASPQAWTCLAFPQSILLWSHPCRVTPPSCHLWPGQKALQAEILELSGLCPLTC